MLFAIKLFDLDRTPSSRFVLGPPHRSLNRESVKPHLGKIDKVQDFWAYYSSPVPAEANNNDRKWIAATEAFQRYALR